MLRAEASHISHSLNRDVETVLDLVEFLRAKLDEKVSYNKNSNKIPRHWESFTYTLFCLIPILEVRLSRCASSIFKMSFTLLL
jgi:hypothetical protein